MEVARLWWDVRFGKDVGNVERLGLELCHIDMETLEIRDISAARKVSEP